MKVDSQEFSTKTFIPSSQEVRRSLRLKNGSKQYLKGYYKNLNSRGKNLHSNFFVAKRIDKTIKQISQLQKKIKKEFNEIKVSSLEIQNKIKILKQKNLIKGSGLVLDCLDTSENYLKDVQSFVKVNDDLSDFQVVEKYLTEVVPKMDENIVKAYSMLRQVYNYSTFKMKSTPTVKNDIEMR